MAKFYGRFDYTIDNKGRVNIPAKFRNAMNPDNQNTFMICRAPNNCLRAYPKDKWDAYEAELESSPETIETLKYKRQLYSTLTDATLDSQGRVSLSANQITIAKIVKEVTLVGQGNYIEIWNTDAHNAYQQQFDDDFDQMFYATVETGMAKK